MLGMCVNNPIPPKKSIPTTQKNPHHCHSPNWKSPPFPHTSFATFLPSLLLMFLVDACTTHRRIRGIPQSQVARDLLQEARSVAAWQGSIPRGTYHHFPGKNANLQNPGTDGNGFQKNDEMKKIQSCQRKVSSIY